MSNFLTKVFLNKSFQQKLKQMNYFFLMKTVVPIWVVPKAEMYSEPCQTCKVKLVTRLSKVIGSAFGLACLVFVN